MTSTTDDTMPAGTMSGTPQVLLAHHLKQLKLPTVLRLHGTGKAGPAGPAPCP